MNSNVKEGKSYLQVTECREGQSKTSGNKYWRLTCNVLPKPGTRLRNMPLDEIDVYYMKHLDWALEMLQDIVVICGSDKPWNLYGKKFIADIKITNGFISLRNPRKWTEEEENPQEEQEGINAQSEWPW